jgi:hypothetical protein
MVGCGLFIDMKIWAYRLTKVLAVLALLCGAANAQPAWSNGHGFGHGRGRHGVPEISAKGMGAGLIVLLGGTAVLLGRRKKAQ